AAAVLTLLPEYLRAVANLRMVIYSIALIALMLLRPRGLLGTREIWDWWRKRRPPRAPGRREASEALIDVRHATIRFGGLTAVCDFSLEVRPRELVALIGPNGAGKTTVFNLLTGVYPPSEGTIKVLGRDTRGLAPHAIAHLGCARTFQNIRLFRELSAFDNVRIGCHHLTHESMAAAVRQGELSDQEEKWVAERSEELLEIMGLTQRRDELAKNLPYGEQLRLEIARALATGPQVLLLDEPAAGAGEPALMAEPLLELQALDVHYGGIHALRGISIRVGQGEIVSLIGANGAGKTTTLRAVSGMLRPSAGQIRYQGAFIGGLKPH